MEKEQTLITLESVENILKDFPELSYPRYYSNGVYEISKGCFTGAKGYHTFIDAVDKELKKTIGRAVQVSYTNKYII